MKTVNVLYAPGTNSHKETLWAFERVGARPNLLMLREVLRGDAQLDSADVLCVPGGFTFGDHLGAGTLAGDYLRTQLADQLHRAMQKPLLAICNGFQIVVRAGVFGEGITLMPNANGAFQNIVEQEHIVERETNSVWLQGLAGMRLRFACAHGEGRFVYREDAPRSWHTALKYPEDANPDGSMDNIGGISTNDGFCFGLMDHPERLLDDEKNLEIFRNGLTL